MIASVYLFHSEGFSERNKTLLNDIASFLAAMSIPFILAGDFNMSQSVFEASGWADSIWARVVAPDIPTYSSAGSSSIIDVFVVDLLLCPSNMDAWCEVLKPVDGEEPVIAKHLLYCH